MVDVGGMTGAGRGSGVDVFREMAGDEDVKGWVGEGGMIGDENNVGVKRVEAEDDEGDAIDDDEGDAIDDDEGDVINDDDDDDDGSKAADGGESSKDCWADFWGDSFTEYSFLFGW